MTDSILARLIGRTYLLDIGEGLAIEVASLDARTRWTWKELLVKPNAGMGQTWVPLGVLTEKKDPSITPDPEVPA